MDAHRTDTTQLVEPAQVRVYGVVEHIPAAQLAAVAQSERQGGVLAIVELRDRTGARFLRVPLYRLVVEMGDEARLPVIGVHVEAVAVVAMPESAAKRTTKAKLAEVVGDPGRTAIERRDRRIQRLRRKGQSVREIALRLDVPEATVERVLRGPG